ncbi:histidine kinase [Paenibacillus sp.]|uniref:sensor histidine kinase n=1 Tax=Paenibacillus sp. TaxID=58172 RepID=UPI00281118E2|nr:histidine kinase [Paenibacillus sp.]
MTLTLRQKIIIGFVLLYSLLAALGFFWYRMSTQTIQDNTISLSNQIIRQMSDRLDYYFTEIEDLMLPIVSRSVTTEFIDQSDAGPYERLLYSLPVSKLFDSLMVGRTDIYGLSVVSQDGIATSTFSNLFAEERFPGIVDRLAKAGTFELIGVQRYSGVPLLTMAAKFYSPSSMNWGVLIVDLKMSTIRSFVSDVELGEHGQIWISDVEGNYLFHPEQDQWGMPVPASYLLSASNEAEGARIDRSSGRNLLVTYVHSDMTRLTFFSEVPLAEINKDLVALRNITIAIGIVIMIVSLGAALTISMSLTDSILVIQRMMKRAESGNLDVRAPETKTGEIGYMYRRFNSMLTEVKNLIWTVGEFQLKEKEFELQQLDSRMQALQYQINPHFLYNTLEIVNSHAIVEDVPVISRIVQSLARIFRYSVENHAKTVPLPVELSHMKDYLDIQSERFEKLQVEIGLDDDVAAHVRIVPMTLQPLLENAFKHGYQKHLLEAVYISVRGIGDEGRFHIDVEDRGHGMEAAVMDRYNRLFLDSMREVEWPGDSRELGLWNVHSRLRLTFGEGCGLSIVRSDRNGTVIRVSLPYE